jgi:hypothetical protein
MEVSLMNTPNQSKPIPLTQEQLFHVISDNYNRYINGDSFRIHYTAHAIHRRDNSNRNMSHDKVLDIIKRPKRLSKDPEWSDKHQSWGYCLQGYNKRELVITVSKGYIDIVTTF